MTIAIARECGGRDWYGPCQIGTESVLMDAGSLATYEARIRADQRERDAKLCEMSMQSVLLMTGELTSSERRTVKAVLANRAAAIRATEWAPAIRSGKGERT